MSKKYRLVIPNHLICAIRDQLRILNNTILRDSGVWNENNEMFHTTAGYIPKEFLQEIKQPETFEEWFHKSGYLPEINQRTLERRGFVPLKDFMRHCHVWTAERDRELFKPVIDAATQAKKELYDYWNSNKDNFTGEVYKRLKQALQQLKEQET